MLELVNRKVPVWTHSTKLKRSQNVTPAVIGKKISLFTLTSGGDKHLTRALALARA